MIFSNIIYKNLSLNQFYIEANIKNLLKIFNQNFSIDLEILVENKCDKNSIKINSVILALTNFLNDYHPKFIFNDIVKTIEELEFIDNLSLLPVFNEFYKYFKFNVKLNLLYESNKKNEELNLNENSKNLIDNYFSVLDKFLIFFK
jgi:hypothetical protein